jgi:hypothetical protein
MRLMAALLALCLGTWLTGCSCPTTLSQDYGRSVTNNTAQQVVNPQAGLETAPAAGLTPVAGTNLYGKYEKTFKAEEKGAAVQLITTK